MNKLPCIFIQKEADLCRKFFIPVIELQLNGNLRKYLKLICQICLG